MILGMMITRARLLGALDHDDMVSLLAEDVDTSDYRLLLNGRPIVCNTDYVVEIFFMFLSRINIEDALEIIDGEGNSLYHSDEFRNDPFVSGFMKPGRG